MKTIEIFLSGLVCLGMLFLSVAGAAEEQGAANQSATTPAHADTRQSPITVIDGKFSPSEVPDVIAYRLYFLVLARDSSSEQDADTQMANVGMLNLEPADEETLIRILDDFKAQDNRIREEHQFLASSGHVDRAKFQEERDALVDSTRDSLRASLSVKGMFALDSAVQLNKSQVKITVTQSTQKPSVAPASGKTSGAVPGILRVHADLPQ